MKKLRIKHKFVPFAGATGNTEYRIIWEVQEHLKLHHWLLPKTWVVRSSHETAEDALFAYGELLALDKEENP